MHDLVSLTSEKVTCGYSGRGSVSSETKRWRMWSPARCWGSVFPLHCQCYLEFVWWLRDDGVWTQEEPPVSSRYTSVQRLQRHCGAEDVDVASDLWKVPAVAGVSWW